MTERVSNDVLGIVLAEVMKRTGPGDEMLGAVCHDLLDARARVRKLECDLAECYKLTGADPDGNEDWRLAPYAVEEVRRMREEYDEISERVLRGEDKP